jgi:hypothetical protein
MLMSVAAETFPTIAAQQEGTSASPAEALSSIAQPLLREMPAMLEYRAEADPDAEFIPKTIAGFALGALAMGVCLDLGESWMRHPEITFQKMLPDFLVRFTFMLGIVGVSTSLLLVGLKVRADHVKEALYARHWLNSIGTGGLYAFMVWGPWFLMNEKIYINQYAAAALWMAVMAFPLFAAKWTIGPHRELPRPEVVQK